MSPQNSQAALAALNGARPVLAHFETSRSAEDLAADIIDLWAGVESSLQSLVGNASLTGQQLVRAARQAELITLEQAHSLLEFLAARDRANRTSYKPTQLSGSSPPTRAAASSPSQPAYTPRGTHTTQPASPYAPRSPGAGGYKQPPTYAKRTIGPPTIEQPPPGSFFTPPGGTSTGGGGVGRGKVEQALAAADRGRFPKISLPILIGAVVVLLIAGGIYWAFRGSSGSDLTAGIDAMNNKQRERARGEFAKAVKSDPRAATPHVFLARLAREDGDLTTARAQLDTALRLEPKNAVALREMGLILFASRQYDLARRFFVRAVQANPQDRAAQGFLGCAMMRLGRVAEGTKWINGAGTGQWQACLTPATTATPPPL